MKRVCVHYGQDEDTWFARSPDVPRWTAVADTREELHQLVEDGVRFALERDDVEIVHLVPASA